MQSPVSQTHLECLRAVSSVLECLHGVSSVSDTLGATLHEDLEISSAIALPVDFMMTANGDDSEGCCKPTSLTFE
jgi:hypothetical protein